MQASQACTKKAPADLNFTDTVKMGRGAIPLPYVQQPSKVVLTASFFNELLCFLYFVGEVFFNGFGESMLRQPLQRFIFGNWNDPFTIADGVSEMVSIFGKGSSFSMDKPCSLFGYIYDFKLVMEVAIAVAIPEFPNSFCGFSIIEFLFMDLFHLGLSFSSHQELLKPEWFQTEGESPTNRKQFIIISRL